MEKKKLYIFSLWIATMSLLLFIVMAHHHHMWRICMFLEQCQEDGDFNDEHTHHHENEQEGCRVHQMHHFFTNTKVVKCIRKHIFDGTLLLSYSQSNDFFIFLSSAIIIRRQEKGTSLSEQFLPGLSRRGPPSIMFFYV